MDDNEEISRRLGDIDARLRSISSAVGIIEAVVLLSFGAFLARSGIVDAILGLIGIGTAVSWTALNKFAPAIEAWLGIGFIAGVIWLLRKKKGL